MQVHFSTDDLPPRDRVRFWCDYFAKQAHSITPSEIPDPGAFRAEAERIGCGRICAARYRIGTREGPTHRGRRRQGQDRGVLHPPIPPAADLEGRPTQHAGRPHSRARRFLRELDRMAIRRGIEGPSLVRHAGHPAGRALAASGGGPTGSPVSVARRLAARLAPRRSYGCGEGAGAAPCRRTRRSRAAQSLRPRGAGVWRLRRGHRAGAGFAAVGAARGGQAPRRSASRRSRPDPRQRRRRAGHLRAPATPAVRAER